MVFSDVHEWQTPYALSFSASCFLLTFPLPASRAKLAISACTLQSNINEIRLSFIKICNGRNFVKLFAIHLNVYFAYGLLYSTLQNLEPYFK